MPFCNVSQIVWQTAAYALYHIERFDGCLVHRRRSERVFRRAAVTHASERRHTPVRQVVKRNDVTYTCSDVKNNSDQTCHRYKLNVYK